MRNIKIIFYTLFTLPIFLVQLLLAGDNTAKQKNAGIRLRKYFETVGGIYLKFGQILALRIDLLPMPVCDELRNLFDKVPPFDFDSVKRQFNSDFNCVISEAFAKFPEVPIASASIGQVYKAKLKSGEIVAVKVRRPNIEKYAYKDLRIVKLLCNTVDILTLKLYRIKELGQEFDQWIREEIDYTHEAENIQSFSKQAFISTLPIFDMPIKINLPKVYKEYSSKNFLTMEYIDGITVNDLIKLKNSSDPTEYSKLLEKGLDIKLVVKKMVDYLIKQLYIDGHFNADPHPANIIITAGNEIYYVDFGLIGDLNERERLSVFRFLRSMTVFDYKTATKAAIVMFNIRDRKKQDKLAIKIRETIDKLSAEVNNSSNYLRFSQKSTVELLKTIVKLGIPIPINISKSLRAAVTSDGLMQSLYPEGDFDEMTKDMYKASIAITYNNILNSLTPQRSKQLVLKIISAIESELIDE